MVTDFPPATTSKPSPESLVSDSRGMSFEGFTRRWPGGSRGSIRLDELRIFDRHGDAHTVCLEGQLRVLLATFQDTHGRGIVAAIETLRSAPLWTS